MSAAIADLPYSDEYFDRIARFLRDKSRLSFTGHKRGILRSRLETRLQQLDMPDFSSYWSHLVTSNDEELHLYDLVTTNETSFFRNSAQFAYLKEGILGPLTRQSAPADRKLRILSAGCSTGEEPYSIAMTILDALPDHDQWQLEIVAGDISDACLQTAVQGYYEAEKLQRVPPNYRERFMTCDDNGASVKDEVRQIVRFTRLNLDELMKADCPAWNRGIGTFDIVFCRNVMIYFAPACQQMLVDTLHRLLLPGGYLFTGDAEPLHLFRHDFITVAEAGCLIYQKGR